MPSNQMEPVPLQNSGEIAKINGRPSKTSLQRAQRTLHDNQLRYAVWLSFPESMRQPATKKEFAAYINVSLMTLHRWDKDPNLIMAVKWLAIQNVGDVGRISNIVTMLYDTAMDPSKGDRLRVEAARDFLKAVGVHEVNKFDNKLLKIEDAADFDLDQLTDEELWELYNERARDAGLSGGYAPVDDSEVIDGEVMDNE
ncbi:MAG TPA: hypothetical protein V6D20_01840 [Candidatus Obscuribacterales bacterium]